MGGVRAGTGGAAVIAAGEEVVAGSVTSYRKPEACQLTLVEHVQI